MKLKYWLAAALLSLTSCTCEETPEKTQPQLEETIQKEKTPEKTKSAETFLREYHNEIYKIDYVNFFLGTLYVHVQKDTPRAPKVLIGLQEKEFKTSVNVYDPTTSQLIFSASDGVLGKKDKIIDEFELPPFGYFYLTCLPQKSDCLWEHPSGLTCQDAQEKAREVYPLFHKYVLLLNELYHQFDPKITLEDL